MPKKTDLHTIDSPTHEEQERSMAKTQTCNGGQRDGQTVPYLLSGVAAKPQEQTTAPHATPHAKFVCRMPMK